MKLKICGIKNIKDLQFCIDRNVDYTGINFYPKSKRYCKNGDILNYINDIDLKNTKLILLTVGNSEDEINDILSKYPMKIIQFAGQEKIELLQKYHSKYKIWKAVNSNNYKSYYDYCDNLLFDDSHGNGIINNFELPKINKSFGIAGGINFNNIEYFKQKYLDAEFLDIASGIEENNIFSQQKAQKLIDLFYDRK